MAHPFSLGWMFWWPLGIFECVWRRSAEGPCRFIQTSTKIKLYSLKCCKISQNLLGSKLDIAAPILGIPQLKGSGGGRHVAYSRGCQTLCAISSEFWKGDLSLVSSSFLAIIIFERLFPYLFSCCCLSSILLLHREACSRKSDQFYYSKQHECLINDPNETCEDLDYYYMLIAWTYWAKIYSLIKIYLLN